MHFHGRVSVTRRSNTLNMTNETLDFCSGQIDSAANAQPPAANDVNNAKWLRSALRGYFLTCVTLTGWRWNSKLYCERRKMILAILKLEGKNY